MKKIILLAIALLVTSCSANKINDPTILKSHANGNPSGEGDGGGDGSGGTPSCTVNLGDIFNAEVDDSFSIPIHINNADVNGTKGYQVTVSVSGPVTITGASCGTFLTDNDASPIFWSGNNPEAGSYTIIAALNPNHCNNVANGTLFNLGLHFTDVGTATVTLVGSPTGAVTPSPYITDCSNYSLGVTYGSTTTTINVVNP